MKVVIIGAGVAGLAIGWRLLQAGCAVTILERGQPARAATWAAAGMLALTAEMQNAAPAERALALESARLWPDFAAQVEQASGQPVGYRRDGALMLDAPEVEGERLDTQVVQDRFPLLAAKDGVWLPEEAQVDNRALGAALTTAFVKAGGTLLPNEAVARIEQQEGRASAVLTPYGRYPADAFLLAAGAWSGLLDEIAITPVKGEMIALAAPSGVALPDPVIWGAGVYLVPRNGMLLVGATVEEAGFDTTPTQAARRFLFSCAQSLIPSLTEWTLAAHWAGLRPKSPDGLPLLGPSSLPNLFVAGGQYRNGILFAPAIAARMTQIMLNGAVPDPAFDPKRFFASRFSRSLS